MSMVTQVKQLVEKLEHIQSDIDFIKGHLTDLDLTEDDVMAVREAEEDYKSGKTKRL